jgi:putative transposase
MSGMSTPSNPYRGYRFPAEIINQAVWFYHCFSLSLREVELILAARGIVVSYETIREWSLRFGRAYANSLKKRRPKPGDKWFLDEVFVRIRGKLYYLWRAVDQHGNVLDVLVQSRRNTKAAKRFFRKLLKGLCYSPRIIVTDKLGSYDAAKREILPGVEHRQSRYLNNRCEVSHQPTRRRERHMWRFRSVRHAQRFSRFTLQSTTTSSSAAIASPPVSTALHEMAPLLRGARPPGLPSWADMNWPDGCAHGSFASSAPS